MNCLRCGQEVSPDQVFCDSCLADMERHPVKAGTPVILPKRSKPLPVKRSHKRIQKPEDQLVTQRRLIGWLFVLIFVLVILIGFLTAGIFHYKNAAEEAQQKQKTIEIVSRETISDSL